MELPVYKIVVNEDDDTGVDVVSFVERPAIQKDFMLFNQQFVEPGAKESEEEFIGRCIPYMVGEGMEQDQAAAVCYSKWQSRQEFGGEGSGCHGDNCGRPSSNETEINYGTNAKENINLTVEYGQKNGLKIEVSNKVPKTMIAMGSYSNKTIFINPNHPYWKNPTENQKKYYESGELSSPNPLHAIHHETAHTKHGDISKTWMYKEHQQKIAEKVSRYAKTNPNEFVAETYAGLKHGIKYDDDVMKLYNIVGGKTDDFSSNFCNCNNNKFESYDDYPEAAKENAKIALRWAEENGWGDCGTPVGKIRANQLANGEAITRETIARMAAFERHRQNSQKELGDGCGRLMWLAWGGDEGIAWAQRKLQQIDMKQAYSVQDEEKRIVTGPAMLSDFPIYRYDDVRGEYYVTFDAPTIWTIAKKFVRKNFYKAVNTDHETPVDSGVHMIESYFIDRERGVMPPKGYEDAKDGSWFLTYLVDNDELWAKVKAGEWKGFSVEGFFDMEQQDDVVTLMREIAQMLKNFA